MNICITGSSGFIGKGLERYFSLKNNYNLTFVTSSKKTMDTGSHFFINTLNSETNFGSFFSGVDVLIHTAGLTDASLSIELLSEINVKGTLNLARQAFCSGVRRFIFISSIKVNGENTTLGNPFSSKDVPAPQNAYSLSKFRAEQGLLQIAAETGMEVVIIRPPLVYGYGVQGNFAFLAQMVRYGVPLPLGTIYNKRSLISLQNLIDLIEKCLINPSAANQVFLASDDDDISTTDLLNKVALALNKPQRFLPFPSSWLFFVATILGKKEFAHRLLGSLQIDISKTKKLLHWTPPLTVEQGIINCFSDKPYYN